jgi:hypothetical protein
MQIEGLGECPPAMILYHRQLFAQPNRMKKNNHYLLVFLVDVHTIVPVSNLLEATKLVALVVARTGIVAVTNDS